MMKLLRGSDHEEFFADWYESQRDELLYAFSVEHEREYSKFLTRRYHDWVRDQNASDDEI